MNTYDLSWWDYKSLFNKYKKDYNIFFETGTHKGDSVRDALRLGFEKVISVEIVPELYQSNADYFNGQDSVHLFLGDSKDKMNEMLNLVDSPALFWLDGHFENGLPIWEELEAIKAHSINTHTIIIDDIGLLFPADQDKLKAKISEINPNYKFVIENQAKCNYMGHPDAWHNDTPWHLVAYID
jgi:hypothetical protein